MSEQQVLPEFIATLKAAAEEATPGPWHVCEPSVRDEHDHELLICDGDFKWQPIPASIQQQNDSNSRFIAEASPENILKLLASLAQSEAERERLQEANDVLTRTVAATIERAATAEAQLARERELNQGLRQESEDNYEQGKKWGLRVAIELSAQQYQKDDNRWNRAIRQYRDAIEEARALLAPHTEDKSKPVVTPMEGK